MQLDDYASSKIIMCPHCGKPLAVSVNLKKYGGNLAMAWHVEALKDKPRDEVGQK
jgi:hypothetical protein